MTSEPMQDAEYVADQRQADAAQRSVDRFKQTAAELRARAQGFDDLAAEWEQRVEFYSSPTTSQVASHGGDSPQRGIGGQGRAGTSPVARIDGSAAGGSMDA